MGQLRRMATVGVLLVLALTLAACSSGPKPGKAGSGSGSGSKSGAKSTTTSTASPTTTTIAAAVKNTLSSAVTAYESTVGVKTDQYKIGRLEVSGVDPSWALFSVLSTSTADTFQGGYGFAHMTGGNWSVVGFGTADVGCPPASGNHLVPAKVLAGFFLSCPTAHS